MSPRELLNTLYVTLPDAYLHLDNDTVRVEQNGETRLRVPLHHLQGIVVVGHSLVSAGLIHRCAEDGRMLVWLDRGGEFKARLDGPVSGNVLLRLDQFRAFQEPVRALSIARCIVAGKLQNSRTNLLRSARDSEGEKKENLRRAAGAIADLVRRIETASDMDSLRGIEGQAARIYFDAFPHMLHVEDKAFHMSGRSRRPPRDPMNALLSFLYTLLIQDCVSAVEAGGLDPQVGYLHTLRPGRPALGLDIAEEFRSVLVDRLAVTIVNRRQLTSEDFVEQPGGSVWMKDNARKKVIVAYQEKKQEEVTHSLLKQSVPWGLLPYVQARLLARTIRGELASYPPFLYH